MAIYRYFKVSGIAHVQIILGHSRCPTSLPPTWISDAALPSHLASPVWNHRPGGRSDSRLYRGSETRRCSGRGCSWHGKATWNQCEPAGDSEEFLKANFPAHYWGSTNLQPTITYSVNSGLSTVTISASVQVPLIFLRVFRVNTATVYATAVATRRTARVIMVLDRSGSMNAKDPISGLNVFTEMQQGAESFAGMFTPGLDEVGLVVFSTSAIVAYPTTRSYNNSPTSAGGPDTTFDVTATSGPLMTQLQAMAAGGGTGTPEALALAYIELQKAHNRDYSLNGGIDVAQNAIVLFTDGVPDSIAVSPNSPGANVVNTSSPCKYKPASGTSTQMMGTIAVPGYPGNWNSPYGLFLLSAYDSANTLTWWLQNPGDGNAGSGDLQQSSPAAAFYNCSGLGDNEIYALGELSQIPASDIYNTPTQGSAYTKSTLDMPNGTSTQPYSGVVYNPFAVSSGNTGAIAAWNATDNVGAIMRAQMAMQPVTLYTIGYSGNGGTDSVLLKRLANTQDSTSYSSSQTSGFYVQVNSADQLGAAFRTIAGQLLRLAK